MGLISNDIDRCMLKEGDHIYAYRNLHIYSHHGIYVGENRVIHFTRTEESSQESESNIESCKECGFNPNTHRGVGLCCVECFLQGHSLHRFDYNVSAAHFLIKRPGTCITGVCNEPDVVVKRAYQLLNDNAFGEYDLYENNCECFAIYCKTDHSTSIQGSMAKIAHDDMKSQPISVKNVAKTLYKSLIKHKFHML